MALKVTLGTNSILGLTGVTSGNLSSPANDDAVLARNSVYSITGSADLNVQLPKQVLGQNWGGSIIMLKNLTTDNNIVTITGEGTGDNQVPINGFRQNQNDYPADGYQINTANRRSAIFYYIDETSGWVSIAVGVDFYDPHIVVLTLAEYRALVDADNIDPDTLYYVTDD